MKLPVAMESVRLGAMHAVDVAELFQRRHGGPRGVQRLDPGHHVDDRLGREARHRRRADVVNAGREPRRENVLEDDALGIESLRHAGRIVDPHRGSKMPCPPSSVLKNTLASSRCS